MEGIASIFCPIIYSIVSQRLRKRFVWSFNQYIGC